MPHVILKEIRAGILEEITEVSIEQGSSKS